MKTATAAVIQKDNKILLGLRVKDNMWEFPGGKLDPGETPEQCAVREVKEELGIDVHVDKFLGTITGTYRNIPMELHAFLTTWTGGDVQQNVHKDLRWVTFEELKDLTLVDEDREVIPLIEKI